MMSKDGLDGGLRGRVLEGIEPRKGTETYMENIFTFHIAIVRRNRTPKGDGNCCLTNIKRHEFQLEGIEPRKGTETNYFFVKIRPTHC